jgi:dolichol-phosphate mannosyltransferase
MDADLSHPPAVLPDLIGAINQGSLLAVGSRYVPGGGVVNWPLKRRFVSRVSCLLARPLTAVKDATSGFFAFRREVIEGVRLNPWGFKIGLEIYVKARHQGKIKEVPFVFTDRRAGESKLSGKVMGLYLKQLWNLMNVRN